MRKVFLIFLSLLFLMAIATQATFARAEFTVTTHMETNTVCPSTTIVIEDVVTASSPGAITITSAGSAANFATVIPYGFWLEPGQSEVVYSYITPSSKVTPGTYVLEVVIAQGIFVKTVKHTVIVENCHNTVIKVEPASQSICACEQKSFLLTVSNLGRYMENYELSIEGPASKWIELSSKSITLAAGSSAKITVNVNTPCNAAGNYDTNFVVKSKSEYAQANVKAALSIVSCYDYTISSDKTYYSICEAEKLTAPIKIKNLGTNNNIYKINLQAPNWTHLDLNQVTIEKGKEATFNLIAEPPYKTQGNFTAYIEVMSDFGKVIKKHDISLQVSKCYDASVTIETDKDKMCNALSNTYSVAIRNTGKFQNTYDIVIEGPDWVTISEKRVTLNASKEKSLVLDVHPPYNTKPGEYKIKVKAIDAISKTEASDTLTVTTVSLEECYSPAISTKDDIVAVSKDNTATALFIIENKGTHDANYTIEVSGTATKFSQVHPGTIALKSTKAQTVYLYLAPPLEIAAQDYVITITVRLEDTTILASKTITVKVLEAGALPQQPQPQPPAVKPAEQSLFSKIFSWFLNLFKAKPATNETKTNVTNVTKTNQTKVNETKTNATNQTQPVPPVKNIAPVLSKKIPDISVQSGKKQTIDLLDYFDDPNADILTFVTVKPQNMTVNIIGSIATLEAQQGFTGTREISFYASDGYDITQSNTLKITVTAAAQGTTPTTNKTNVTKTNATNASCGNESCTPATTPTKIDWQKFLPWIIVAVIAILIIVIITTGLGKKIVDFFEEDVSNGNGRKNNNHKK